MRASAAKLAVLVKLAEPKPVRKPPVPTPLTRSTHIPKPPAKPRVYSAKCRCGSLECKACYRRIFSALRRKGLVGLGNKWNMMAARNDDERMMVRIKNNRNWPGPDPSPLSSSALLMEASIYIGGLQRLKRVRSTEILDSFEH